MEKVNWKRFFIVLAIYIIIDVVLVICRNEELISKTVYFILHMINLAAFIFWGITRSRPQK